jgi:integrase
MWLPTLGACPLDQLTPQHCRRALADLLSPESPGVRAYAPSTVVKARAILSMALADAVDDELIPRNPLRRVPPPRIPEREPRPFTVPEVRRILQSVQHTPLVAAVTLACCYGLRAGEVAGLQWADITETSVSIQRQHPGTGVGHRATKTPAATRSLPLIPLVAAALAQQRTLQDASQYVVGVRRESLGRQWRQHVQAAGIPRRTFHELRHAAVTLLASLGVDEQVRMMVVGHSAVAVHRRYRAVSGELVADALARLGDAIQPP